MEMIENLVELRNFLNSKTEEELEKMSFEFELIYWDNHWLREESEEHEISHMTFDNGNLVCHEYRKEEDNA
jgi:hypothetical protein